MTALRCASKGASRHAVSKLRPPSPGQPVRMTAGWTVLPIRAGTVAAPARPYPTVVPSLGGDRLSRVDVVFEVASQPYPPEERAATLMAENLRLKAAHEPGAEGTVGARAVADAIELRLIEDRADPITLGGDGAEAVFYALNGPSGGSERPWALYDAVRVAFGLRAGWMQGDSPRAYVPDRSTSADCAGTATDRSLWGAEQTAQRAGGRPFGPAGLGLRIRGAYRFGTGLARGVEWLRLALLPGPRPEARKPPTRPSAREARSQGKQSSDLRGQHLCGAGGDHGSLHASAKDAGRARPHGRL